MSNRPPCWGIGLGRTGTNTFCKALSILGDERGAHNPLFEQLSFLEGGTDNGVALFYNYLDCKCPGSKFLLMLRSLASWLPVAAYGPEKVPLHSHNDDIPIMRRMLIYETVTFDAAEFTAAYQRHYEDVRRYFVNCPDDLTEMNIVEKKEGWERLCPFHGLPIPDQPFPFRHSGRGDGGQREMFVPANGDST